jgi:hypothetical protein
MNITDNSSAGGLKENKNSPCRAKEWIALIAHSVQGLN